MIGLVKEHRNLFDILIGRPKGYFAIPRTWPDDWPDYGIGGTSPSRVESKADTNVKQPESKNSK